MGLNKGKKKGGKKKKKGGGRSNMKSAKQWKMEEENREKIRAYRAEHGMEPIDHGYIKPERMLEHPTLGLPKCVIGGDGSIRRKFKMTNYAYFDSIKIDNYLIKWKPMYVQNQVEHMACVLEDGSQLVWEKTESLRYLRKSNCFVILGSLPDLIEIDTDDRSKDSTVDLNEEKITVEPDQPPDMPPSYQGTRNQPEKLENNIPPPVLERKLESKWETRLKKAMVKHCQMERFKPICLAVFDLPDQIWQIKQPELWTLGLDSFALFGNLEVKMKEGQQSTDGQPTDQPSVSSGPGGQSWEDEQAQLLAKIAQEQTDNQTQLNNLDTHLPREEDVRTVMMETSCSQQEAQLALARNNGDIVDAILDASM